MIKNIFYFHIKFKDSKLPNVNKIAFLPPPPQTPLRSSYTRFRRRHQGSNLSAQAARKFSILLAMPEPVSGYCRNKN